MKKICLITCYSQPDYIRARTLRAAFTSMPDVELIIVKNTHTNILRYPETLWRVIMARIKYHPDIYFQTFRAYEFFPFIRLATIGKHFIFDEFINPIEQVAYENHYIKPGGFIETVARLGYKLWVLTVAIIVTDTPSHARYSAELMKLPIDRYVPLIVSSDERVFTPSAIRKDRRTKPFTVFYYGLFMMPLQGLPVILEAMKLIKEKDIRLVLIGGREKTKDIIQSAVARGAHIDYLYRVGYDELPDYIDQADICLAGPFGGTVQAQYIIGGKTYQFLNMGKPVIIGKNEESHIWTDKQDALIVNQADPLALADAIVWASEHPSELDSIAKAGQALYEQKLSNAILADQLRGLLASKRLL